MNYFRRIIEVAKKGEGREVMLKNDKDVIVIFTDNTISIYHEMVQVLIDVRILFLSNPMIYERLDCEIRRGLVSLFDNGTVEYEVAPEYGMNVYCRIKDMFLMKLVYEDPFQRYRTIIYRQKLNLVRERLSPPPNDEACGHPYQKGNDRSEFLRVHKDDISIRGYVGQFNREFLIVEINGYLCAIDQHAIDERIRLERLLNEVQRGYFIDDCGLLDRIKNMACKGAIKFGDMLSKKRVEKVFFEIKKCKFPFICAHGRPSIVVLKKIRDDI
jgi:hypothetical protein